MSWTDADTIKIHLQSFTVDSLTVKVLSLTLEGVTQQQLPHNTLLSGSVRVASQLAADPTGPVEITLTGTSWYPLGYQNILPGSVVVGNDDFPSTRYVEGADYAVKDVDGEIKRLSGSSIASGATIYVWLLPLTVYVEDQDYEVDHSAGRISRKVGSSIPDPARVLLDYQTSAAGASVALISRAITEAEEKITARLRDEYSTSSTDEGLKIGATELTLSIICDDLALRSLSGVGDPSSDDRARRFMELAVRYGQRATTTLGRFLTQPIPSSAILKNNPPAPNTW